MFFFFQAEDGIRDYKVTGVQTCALPICVLAEAAHQPVEEIAHGKKLPLRERENRLDFQGTDRAVRAMSATMASPAAPRHTRCQHLNSRIRVPFPSAAA